MAEVFKGGPGNNMGKRKINFGESLFFIFFILLASFVLLVSPLFEIREITVEGNRELTPEKIIAQSGITAGVNIFKVNLRESAAAVKTLPMVKEADVFRDLPGRVVIKVAERKPVALVPAQDGFVAVDMDGVCVRGARVGEKGLPVITGIDAQVPYLGQSLQSENLAFVLKVIAELPAELVNNLSEVKRDQNGQIILYTLQGVPCRLGYPDDAAKKGTILIQVLKELRGRKIEYIDLSLPGAPVVKFEK